MNGVQIAAELMAVSARTAPKGGGIDYIETRIIEGEHIKELAAAMLAYGEKSGKPNFDRDGRNVARSEAVLLISLKDSKATGMNCGACGFSGCKDLPERKAGSEFDGPLCPWRVLDLGIAAGSAVKTASILNIDNRIMYRVGVCARQLGMIDGELVLGIPLSATGKSIYFDR